MNTQKGKKFPIVVALLALLCLQETFVLPAASAHRERSHARKSTLQIFYADPAEEDPGSRSGSVVVRGNKEAAYQDVHAMKGSLVGEVDKVDGGDAWWSSLAEPSPPAFLGPAIAVDPSSLVGTMEAYSGEAKPIDEEGPSKQVKLKMRPFGGMNPSKP